MEDQCQHQDAGRNSDQVEEPDVQAQDAAARPNERRQVREHEQHPKLGAADRATGDPEHPGDVSRQRDLDAEQQVGHQQRHGGCGVREARQGEARQQGSRAETVDEVVDVEPVARARAVPKASQRSVKAVAEPVQQQAEVHAVEPLQVPRRERIGDAPTHQREQAQRRQVVRLDPPGHPSGQPAQHARLGVAHHSQLTSCFRVVLHAANIRHGSCPRPEGGASQFQGSCKAQRCTRRTGE